MRLVPPALRLAAAVGGAQREVAQLYPGDDVGEASLLTGAPRNANVTATTDGCVYEVDRDDFEPLLRERPAMGKRSVRPRPPATRPRRPMAPAANGPSPTSPTDPRLLPPLNVAAGVWTAAQRSPQA